MVRVASLLIVCCLQFVPGLVGAQSQDNQVTSGSAPPGIFVVSSVAYRDFDHQLKEWERKWTVGGNTESKAQQYASNISNYKIELFAENGKVYVTFTIRPLGGSAVFGGTSRYVLDEKTAAVLEHTGEK